MIGILKCSLRFFLSLWAPMMAYLRPLLWSHGSFLPLLPSVQWNAVATTLAEIKLPPHSDSENVSEDWRFHVKWKYSILAQPPSILTTQGKMWGSASIPPMILCSFLFSYLLLPQEQLSAPFLLNAILVIDEGFCVVVALSLAFVKYVRADNDSNIHSAIILQDWKMYFRISYSQRLWSDNEMCQCDTHRSPVLALMSRLYCFSSNLSIRWLSLSLWMTHCSNINVSFMLR